MPSVLRYEIRYRTNAQNFVHLDPEDLALCLRVRVCGIAASRTGHATHSGGRSTWTRRSFERPAAGRGVARHGGHRGFSALSSSRPAGRLLKGLASPEEAKAVRQECLKKRAKNPFCPIVRDAKRLKAFFEETERPYRFREPSPRVPVPPEIVEGKITNYAKLRKTDVDNLLPAFKTLPPEGLLLVKEAALASKGCPDNAAIALAATLEDGMPSKVDPKEVAALYARVGGCFPKRSTNREHFLTRAGLLWFYAGDYRLGRRSPRAHRGARRHGGAPAVLALSGEKSAGRHGKGRQGGEAALVAAPAFLSRADGGARIGPAAGVRVSPPADRRKKTLEENAVGQRVVRSHRAAQALRFSQLVRTADGLGSRRKPSGSSPKCDFISRSSEARSLKSRA